MFSVILATHSTPAGGAKVHKAINGGREVIREVLNATGLGHGETWMIRPVSQVTMRGGARFRVCKVDMNLIYAKVRPGGNDSCWEWEIRPPVHLNANLVVKAIEDTLNHKEPPVTRLNIPLPAAPAPTPSDPLAGLASRLTTMEAASREYLAREAKIRELSDEWQRVGKELEALEKAHTTDAAGAEAAKMITTLRKLLG